MILILRCMIDNNIDKDIKDILVQSSEYKLIARSFYVPQRSMLFVENTHKLKTAPCGAVFSSVHHVLYTKGNISITRYRRPREVRSRSLTAYPCTYDET